MDFLNIQETGCEQLKAEIKRLKNFLMTARVLEPVALQINQWISVAEQKIAACDTLTNQQSQPPVTNKSKLYGSLKPFLIVAGVVAAGLLAYKIFKK